MERKKYALAAAGYLLNKLPDPLFRKVKQVVLFGSVATGTATPESDADLFFDISMTAKESTEAKRILNKAAQNFYLTSDALKFKLEGISNPISAHAGKLDEWKELKESIESTGVILYGPYTSLKKVPKRYVIFYWKSLHMPNRGAFLNKLYGYTAAKKRYTGLIERISGKKIGKSAILILLRHKNEIMRLMEKYGVDYNIVEV